MAAHQQLHEPLDFLTANVLAHCGDHVALTLLQCTKASRTTTYALLQEVGHKLFANGNMRTENLRRHCCNNGGVKHVSKASKDVLCTMGVCDARGCLPLCASVATLSKVLPRKHFKMPKAVLDSFDKILENATPVIPPERIPLAPETFTAIMPESLPEDVPVLGPYCFPRLDNKHPRLFQQHVLQTQLQEFEAFTTGTFVLKRQSSLKRKTSLPISDESFEGILKSILQFLGYCHDHKQVPVPNLHHVLNADLLASYMSSRIKSGLMGSTMYKEMYAFRWAVAWWLKTDFGKDHRLEVQDLKDWLDDVAPQIKAYNPSTGMDPHVFAQQMQAAVQYDAAEVIHILSGRYDLVVDMCKQGVTSVEQARTVHDAVIGCCLFGWAAPCMRSQVVRSLIGPDTDVACPFKRCRAHHGCHSNKILRLGSQQFMLIISHHKTLWSRGVMQFLMPEDMNLLLDLYQCHAYPLLKQWAQDRGHDHPYMFMNKLGQAFKGPNFSSYCTSMMTAWDGPKARGPHYLRHLFVAERLSHDAVPGPQDEAAAAAMGNSTATWLKSYAREGRNVEGQKWVNHLASWRKALLEKRQQQQQRQAKPDADGDVFHDCDAA